MLQIITTEEHPFWVEGYGFVPAGELAEGDYVENAKGESLRISKVEIEYLAEPVTVYNFEVEDWHTYYVSEEEIFVHNDCKVDTTITNATTRRQAFREAKEAAGIPKSSQFKTHSFVYDGSTDDRIVYEFEVEEESLYIVEHPFDENGRGDHFHIADDLKGSPFEKGRYNQHKGHFPEDFDGFN